MVPRFEIDAVTVAAGGRRLLEAVSCSLAPGEVVGLAGPSGLGKTSLLRALARLEEPAEGRVRVDGKTAEELGFPPYRRRVVYVAQRPTVIGPTVGDDLRVPFSFAIAAGPFDEGAAMASLERLGLERDLEAPVERWSEGEKQRLALIRALSVGPRVLLLDEPTSALDAASRGRVEAWLAELAAEGTAMFVVSHERAQLRRVASRVVDLERFRGG